MYKQEIMSDKMQGNGLHNIIVPHLCVPGGDVLVRLTDQPEDDIVVSSAALEKSLYFRRIITGDKHWSDDSQAKQAKVQV